MKFPYYVTWLQSQLEEVGYNRDYLPGAAFRLACFSDVTREACHSGLIKVFFAAHDRPRIVSIAIGVLREGGLERAAALLEDAQWEFRRALDEVDDLSEEEEKRVEQIEEELLPILREHTENVGDAYVRKLITATTENRRS